MEENKSESLIKDEEISYFVQKDVIGSIFERCFDILTEK